MSSEKGCWRRGVQKTRPFSMHFAILTDRQKVCETPEIRSMTATTTPSMYTCSVLYGTLLVRTRTPPPPRAPFHDDLTRPILQLWNLTGLELIERRYHGQRVRYLQVACTLDTAHSTIPNPHLLIPLKRVRPTNVISPPQATTGAGACLL